MRRVLLLVAVVSTLSMAGCLEGGVGDWVGGEDREVRQIHAFTEAFSYSGVLDPESPPGSAEDLFQKGSTSFDVPEGTEAMTVHYAIQFGSPDQGTPPSELQQLQLAVGGPGAEENASTTAVQSSQGTWSYETPNPGPWMVTYQARGEGSITVVVFGSVPTDA